MRLRSPVTIRQTDRALSMEYTCDVLKATSHGVRQHSPSPCSVPPNTVSDTKLPVVYLLHWTIVLDLMGSKERSIKHCVGRHIVSSERQRRRGARGKRRTGGNIVVDSRRKELMRRKHRMHVGRLPPLTSSLPPLFLLVEQPLSPTLCFALV